MEHLTCIITHQHLFLPVLVWYLIHCKDYDAEDAGVKQQMVMLSVTVFYSSRCCWYEWNDLQRNREVFHSLIPERWHHVPGSIVVLHALEFISVVNHSWLSMLAHQTGTERGWLVWQCERAGTTVPMWDGYQLPQWTVRAQDICQAGYHRP